MLNQLATLAERIGGSNELVDNWLYNRKQLLVHYYNLVGITPGKGSYMQLNEKRWTNSVITWLNTFPPVILIFMNGLSVKWKGPAHF